MAHYFTTEQHHFSSYRRRHRRHTDSKEIVTAYKSILRLQEHANKICNSSFHIHARRQYMDITKSSNRYINRLLVLLLSLRVSSPTFDRSFICASSRKKIQWLSLSNPTNAVTNGTNPVISVHRPTNSNSSSCCCSTLCKAQFIESRARWENHHSVTCFAMSGVTFNNFDKIRSSTFFGELHGTLKILYVYHMKLVLFQQMGSCRRTSWKPFHLC